MSQQLEVQENTILRKELDGESVPLTKKSIRKAAPNSINVINNGFAYDEYFKMGGTVAKMTFQSTKNFQQFRRNKKNDS
jgi:hypothetical protein